MEEKEEIKALEDKVQRLDRTVLIVAIGHLILAVGCLFHVLRFHWL